MIRAAGLAAVLPMAAAAAEGAGTLDVFLTGCLDPVMERREIGAEGMRQLHGAPFGVSQVPGGDLVMTANSNGTDCSVGERAPRAGTFEAFRDWADAEVGSGRFEEMPVQAGRLRMIARKMKGTVIIVRLSKVTDGGYSLGAGRYVLKGGS